MTGERPFDAEATVRHLADRWSGADTRLLRFVFPLLAAGQAVPVEAVAHASGAPSAHVERALARARAGRNDRGHIVELSGLTLAPTIHRLDTGGVVLFACCALFALMVPRLLGRRVRIQSLDPVSAQHIVLEVSPEVIEHVDPADAQAGVVTTTRFHPAQDIAASFCTQVNYFAGSATAARWRHAGEGRHVIPLEELAALASRLHRAVWA